jgi:hypothetical protein
MNRDKLLKGKLVQVITNRTKSLYEKTDDGEVELVGEQPIAISGFYYGSDDNYIFLGDAPEKNSQPFHILNHTNVTDIIVIEEVTEDEIEFEPDPNGAMN